MNDANSKPWYSSKTILFNLAVCVLALPDVTAIIPDKAKPYVLAFVAAGNLVLRLTSKLPIGVLGSK